MEITYKIKNYHMHKKNRRKVAKSQIYKDKYSLIGRHKVIKNIMKFSHIFIAQLRV